MSLSNTKKYDTDKKRRKRVKKHDLGQKNYLTQGAKTRERENSNKEQKLLLKKKNATERKKVPAENTKYQRKEKSTKGNKNIY